MFFVQYPVKLKSKVESAGHSNGAEQILQEVGLVDTEDEAILFHQMQVDVEEVDATAEEEEQSGEDEGENVEGEKEEKVSHCCGKVLHCLVLPVIVLYVPQNFCIGSVVGCREADEVGKRNDYLKTLRKNKDLYRFLQLFQTCLRRLPFCLPSAHNKVKVDKEINPNQNIDGKI